VSFNDSVEGKVEQPARASARTSAKNVVALGARIGDPIIGLVITLVILKITWASWRTVSTSEPGELVELHEH
jgi:hypothetical protein